jgi:hypothetical protein
VAWQVEPVAWQVEPVVWQVEPVVSQVLFEKIRPKRLKFVGQADLQRSLLSLFNLRHL